MKIPGGFGGPAAHLVHQSIDRHFRLAVVRSQPKGLGTKGFSRRFGSRKL
jgi:hypothetical protein